MLWYVATYEYKIIICIANCHQQLSTNIYLLKVTHFPTRNNSLSVPSYHLAKTKNIQENKLSPSENAEIYKTTVFQNSLEQVLSPRPKNQDSRFSKNLGP